MALFDRETDPVKEKEGVPLDFGDYRVTLRRAGGANDRFELELDRALKPFRALLRHGKMPKAQEQELVFRVFSRTCIVKWETRTEAGEWQRGIDMRGTLVPDTEDNLVAVFQALPSVFLDVQAAAKGEDLFRLEQREDDTGN